MRAAAAARAASPRWRAAAIVVAYLAAYVALDRVSYILPVLPLGISPWNPPPGLSLFLLLTAGLQYWPLLPVAVFAAEYVTRGLPSPLPLLLATLVITAAYTACAALLRRRLTRGAELESPRDLVWFIGATLSASLVVAGGYVAVFTAVGELDWSDYAAHTVRFWIGDLDGILVVTPLLLVLRRWRARWPAPGAWPELALQAAALLAALWLVFRAPNLAQFQFFYVLFLPLVWIVSRHGLHGAVLSLAATQLGLIAVAPAEELYAVTFIRYQFLLFSLCAVGLTLGVFGSQRRRDDAALRDKDAQLARALQFAAAGEMSSALAHELNQPITAVANYVGAARLMIDGDAPRAQLENALAQAVAEAQRAGLVMHRLRAFFQHGRSARENCELAALAHNVVRRLATRCQRSGASIEVRAEPVPAVTADPVQVELILHNLIGNALDAIERSPAPDPPRRGPLPATVRVQIRAGAARAAREPAAPESVDLTVEDDAGGVDADIVGRLFQPFTTSKPDGMGLGLAISRSLVEALGGALTYERPAQGGSRFRLRLPVAAGRSPPFGK